MTREQIMKLQTYKMFEDEDTVYVERDDVLKLLEQHPSEDWLDTFNTDSATECFTAVQKLKEMVKNEYKSD